MTWTARVALRRMIATLIYCCTIPLASAAASAPPPEAFGSMPAESDAVLNPDGHWLVWLDRKEAKPRVIMFNVSDRKVQRILAPS